jgi:hypothetical protein
MLLSCVNKTLVNVVLTFFPLEYVSQCLALGIADFSVYLQFFLTVSEVFRKILISTIVRWAEESQIETSKLVREMFRQVVKN